jgi:hypothetical protein
MLDRHYKQTHYDCLDLCDFSWRGTPASQLVGSESAILLEVWHSGGLFQTTNAIPKRATVLIGAASSGIQVEGLVQACRVDAYGFLVEVRILDPAHWFPGVYQPPYLTRQTRVAA